MTDLHTLSSWQLLPERASKATIVEIWRVGKEAEGEE